MLQGRAIFNRGIPGDYAKGIQCFKDALALDANSAPTWTALAVGYGTEAAQGSANVAASFALAREAANRAIALDPESAQAYYALGFVQFLVDWDWPAAEASMQRALALAPNDVNVLSTAATIAQTAGQADRGLALSRKAVELDPLAFLPAYSLAKSLFQAGRYAEMEQHAERIIAVNPGSRYGYVFLTYARLLRGEVEAAAKAFAPLPPDLFQQLCVALVRHAQGRATESAAAIDEMIAKFADHGCYQIAEAYAYRQQADRAFEWLEKGLLTRDSGMTWISYDPLLKNLHADPRWPILLRKMKLADDQLK
jgi:tetratricopeptide (TPR) repeat protein